MNNSKKTNYHDFLIDIKCNLLKFKNYTQKFKIFTIHGIEN